MGIASEGGLPTALCDCYRMGYRLFDCALPTRDARRGRLYAFTTAEGLDYRRIYIRDGAYHADPAAVSEHCDCLCCRRYSRAYLHHLFAVGDVSAWRLATIHNLRFYAMLTARLRTNAPGWTASASGGNHLVPHRPRGSRRRGRRRGFLH